MFKRRPRTEVQPEFLIVGLGNPGPQYRGTRHNVGFEVVEALAKANKIELKTHRFQAQTGVGLVAGHGVVLAKPITYMNLSGQAVRLICTHIGLTPTQIMVIADDLDLDVGRVRIRPGGGAGGHNGHRSIIGALGTDQYARVKIGIGKGPEGIDHVLGRFTPDEKTEIASSVAKCVKACECWVAEGIDIAMNKFNPD